jgi:hypothetical protein
MDGNLVANGQITRGPAGRRPDACVTVDAIGALPQQAKIPRYSNFGAQEKDKR